jgi:hypothetical protein
LSEQKQQQGTFNDLLSMGSSDAQVSSPSRSNASNGNIDDIMNLFNTSSNSGVQTFTPSPQQQQNNVMNDFTNDLFGSTTTQSPTQQQQPPSSSSKDPFADLF